LVPGIFDVIVTVAAAGDVMLKLTPRALVPAPSGCLT
jgi:hypothetical protein